MEQYLRWRFNCDSYVRNKYGRYFNEWFKGLTEEQMAYFRLERERLTQMGIYKV